MKSFWMSELYKTKWESLYIEKLSEFSEKDFNDTVLWAQLRFHLPSQTKAEGHKIYRSDL